MTALLGKAIKATKALDPDMQDEAARLLLLHAGLDADEDSVVELTDDEKAAIEIGLAAAARGDFATDEQVRAIWAKHGL